ncbi:MAG: adventurous gliding motility lipoprotein CglB [Archangium sp.]
MNRAALLVGISLFVTSCQTYDFERVVPLAVAQTTDKKVIKSKALKPNIMLLVDNSGSMDDPTDKSNPACGGCTGNACGAGCPTRIREMKSAMNTFLTGSGSVGRLGLTIYPVFQPGQSCNAASAIDQQFPAPTATDDGTDAALQSQAIAVNTRIQALTPGGGTPTGNSLRFVGDYAGLNDANDQRDDFVLLLTDGLPNCNSQNPKNVCGCQPGSCDAAQLNACACTGTSNAACLNSFSCSLSCLDDDGSVEAVRALRMKNIKTIVVGFGADLATGSGPAVLNALAKEGGFPRTCPDGTDAECGTGNTCIVADKVCSQSFYQAANGAELATALTKISNLLGVDACTYTLSEQPSDKRYLAVVMDGQTLSEGAQTYTYDYGTSKVTFVGEACTKITSSTVQNPVNVEFRIVTKF